MLYESECCKSKATQNAFGDPLIDGYTLMAVGACTYDGCNCKAAALASTFNRTLV